MGGRYTRPAGTQPSRHHEPVGDGRPEQTSTTPADDQAPLRVAILDRELGLLVSLGKRIERLGWEQSTLPVRVPLKTLTALDADVLIVDLAVLGERRWRWLRALCRQRPDLAIIVCTERSTVGERVAALRLGVADWLAKPYHPEELIARAESVSAHARRFQRRVPALSLPGGLEISPRRFQAFACGRSLALTRTEYQLLELLARRGGETLSRETIYQEVWSQRMARDDRSVDVVVYRLRRKLEQALPQWRYIHTHRGVGYRFAAEVRAVPTRSCGSPAPAPRQLLLAA